MISEAEGITGLISQVTLRVQPAEELDILSIGCADPNNFQKLIEAMVAADLPIWSMMFINPKMAELKNQSPQNEHGHSNDVVLPITYILTLSMRMSESRQVRDALPAILSGSQAEILSNAIAQHEWENRFKLMVVKRLGPSLVPTEVVLPLKNLGKALVEISQKVQQPVVKEGVVIRKGLNGEPEVVILGFIPADQRKLSYNFVFALALTVIGIAERLGGRSYSTGLYFSRKVERVMGKPRVEALRAYKNSVDPNQILNPGKVIGDGALSAFMALAGWCAVLPTL